MNILIWTVQVLLGLMFVAGGVMKVFRYEATKKSMPWVGEYSKGFVMFVGAADLLGGLGVVLPEATGIAPVLTPIAAIGLAVIMLLALIFHIRRGEYGSIGMNAIMLALAVFVAIARF